jgi:hypothetical protein
MSPDEESKPNYLTHSEPIWRDQANYLLMAEIDGDLEQLWAREITETTFMICCIPLFIYNVALGDIVEAVDNQVTRVVKPSGRYVLRVWLPEKDQALMNRIKVGVGHRGGFWEHSSDQLLGVDAPDAAVATEVRAWLEELQAEGLIEYETGWI